MVDIPCVFYSVGGLSEKYIELSILILIITGGLSLVVIGYDYTRMLVIAFPAVLLSYEWMMRQFEPERFRKFTLLLILLNFLILQYHFNYDGAQPMFPWILNKVSERFGIPLV